MSVAELETAVPPVPHICSNCGEAGVRKYCPACGESRPGAGDLALSHFLGHAVHELVHLDSKIFRSFAYLITRPGFLTAEYFAGRKTRYISPLRIFLTVFALSLIAYTVYQPVSVWDFGRMVEADTTGKLTSKLEAAAATRGITAEILYERITVSWQAWIVRTQFVNIVFVALGLQILYWRRKRFFVEHLVFALHLQSALLLLSLMLWPVWAIFGLDMARPRWELVAINMLASLVISVLSVGRYYGQERWRRVTKGVVLYAFSYAASIVVMMGTMILALIGVLRTS